MPRVLLTGASGFLGKPTLALLAGAGHEVLCLGRKIPERSRATANIRWHEADLEFPETYRREVKSFAPEVLVHLAWKGIPDFSTHLCLTNLKLSVELAEAAIAGGKCAKLLAAGSCFEYDRMFGACLESEPGKPRDTFTWAKHSLFSCLDLLCREGNVALGWLRAFYIYGPGQRPGSLVPMIFSALKGNHLPPLRTPKNSNDFVYVDDVARGFALAVGLNFPSGIYNLGSGVATPVADVCEMAETLVTGGYSLTEALRVETRESGQSCNFWADCSRSEKILGWKASTTLAEGIRRYRDSIP